jgi:hypothetical protein
MSHHFVLPCAYLSRQSRVLFLLELNTIIYYILSTRAEKIGTLGVHVSAPMGGAFSFISF